MPEIPRVFISYSHDSPSHKQWIAELATKLRQNGVETILDQWDLRLGDDVTLFMEDGLSSSNRVLVICTDEYVRKADAGEGGVGYERLIVTAELIRNLDTSKFIPVIRQSGTKKVPKFLSTRLYIDLSDDLQFNEQSEVLLREIHKVPIITKPPLGKNPFELLAPGNRVTATVASNSLSHAPVIQSVVMNTDNIEQGGKVTVTVRARSDAPVNWLDRSLDGPNSNLYGGGSIQTFVEISPNIWETQWTDKISEWAPSGVYTYRNISVKNERLLTSETWAPLTFTVRNSNTSQTPTILSVVLSTQTVKNGGSVTVTLRTKSNAPICWLNRTLDGPNGNIYGGGGGTQFTKMSPDTWETQWTDPISKWAPSGVYTYRNISVMNEGQLTSALWHPLNFTVDNSN